jgi:hypothetical protein
MSKRHQPESQGLPGLGGGARRLRRGAEDDGSSEGGRTVGGFASLATSGSSGGTTLRTEQTFSKAPLPERGTGTNGQPTRAPAYSQLMKCAAVGDANGVQALLKAIFAARQRANDAGDEPTPPDTATRGSSAWGDLSGSGPGNSSGRTAAADAATTVAEDLFGQDRKGRTALDWARLGRHFACADLLQAAMAEDIDRSLSVRAPLGRS